MRTALHLDTRGETAQLLTESFERVVEADFDGIEFAGLAESDLLPTATALGQTKLAPVGVHVPYDRLQVDRRQVVHELATIGCKRVVIPSIHPDHFASHDAVARMATRLSALGGRLRTDGRLLCYQNDDHEFRGIDDGEDGSVDAYDLLVERAGEGLAFELDVGGVVTAGRDPVSLLHHLDGRVPIVTLRDVTAIGEPVALGEGIVNVEEIVIAARDTSVEWLVFARHGPGQSEGTRLGMGNES